MELLDRSWWIPVYMMRGDNRGDNLYGRRIGICCCWINSVQFDR